jgi:hypothetical protein
MRREIDMQLKQFSHRCSGAPNEQQIPQLRFGMTNKVYCPNEQQIPQLRFGMTNKV